jgi:anti-sigma B factor antagonist
VELTASIEGTDVLVISLGEESLDAGNVRAFREAALALLQGHTRVVLDLGGVQFVDSSGLGALLACLRQANLRRGDLRLCQLTPPVQALFDLMRMHRVLQIRGTRDEAVRSYAAS